MLCEGMDGKVVLEYFGGDRNVCIIIVVVVSWVYSNQNPSNHILYMD